MRAKNNKISVILIRCYKIKICKFYVVDTSKLSLTNKYQFLNNFTIIFIFTLDKLKIKIVNTLIIINMDYTWK